LGATTHVPKDSFDPQFNLSSEDGQLNLMSKPNPGGYVKGLCDGIFRQFGQEFAVGRVLVQQ
jgi:hypothetical protein